jgi:hypothetical protein
MTVIRLVFVHCCLCTYMMYRLQIHFMCVLITIQKMRIIYRFYCCKMLYMFRVTTSPITRSALTATTESGTGNFIMLQIPAIEDWCEHPLEGNVKNNLTVLWVLLLYTELALFSQNGFEVCSQFLTSCHCISCTDNSRRCTYWRSISLIS